MGNCKKKNLEKPGILNKYHKQKVENLEFEQFLHV